VVAAAAALSALVLVPAPQAHAQQPQQPPAQNGETAPAAPPAEGEKPRRQFWNLSLFTGGSATRSSDVRLLQHATHTDATFHGVNWAGKPFSGSVYYGYRVGTFFKNTPRVGMELEFLHAKAYAKVQENRRITGTWHGQPVDETAPMDSRVQEFRITNGINTISLNLLYRVPVYTSPSFPDGRIQPYALMGLSYYLLYAINTVDGEDNQPRGYRNSDFGYNLGLGVRYAITPRVSLFVEGRYTEGDARVNIARGGEGFTSLRTLHSIGGITYGF
jgi:Opacity protein and related surface antigens